MGSAKEPDRPPLVELGQVPESWVDGIGEVQLVGGGVYRILLYRVHRPPGGGPVEHEVVFSVLTNLANMGSVMTLLRALAEGAMERVALLLH